MKGWSRLFSVLVWLALFSGAGVRPAAAAGIVQVSALTDSCEMSEFYMYNGTLVEVYVDVANWTIATRVILPEFGPGEEATFLLEPGVIEFYVYHRDTYSGEEWQAGKWVVVAECDRVAAYIKETIRPEVAVYVK